MLIINEKNELSENDVIAWQKLWEKLDSAHFFNSYRWYLACKNGLKQKVKVWFAYYNTELIGIFSLCVSKRYGIKCWTIIGKPYTDKCSILFDGDYYDYLPQILLEIGKKRPVVLEEVPETWNNNAKNQVLHEVASINPYVKLNEDILSQVKRKEWNNIKRKAEKSELFFKVFKPCDVRDNIHILWEIEGKSNKPSKNREMFGLEKTRDMFQIVAEGDDSMLFVLYDGDNPIAHMFGYNIKNRVFHAHHMSYDQDYFKQTPGKIVIYWLISFLKENGFCIFDFSRGETMLKDHFSTYKESNYVYYYNVSFFAMMWFKISIFVKEKYYYVRKLIKHLYLRIKGRKTM